MSLGTFSRCCYCIDLRTGSFIIAYLLLVSRGIHFMLSCIHLSGINTTLSEYTNHHLVLMHNDLVFSKLILCLGILVLCFELLITAALLNGLYKKIQDQIQMFYVGGFVFEVLRLILLTAVLMRYWQIMGKLYHSFQWISLVVEVLSNLLYIYFLTVIRSYYFQLRYQESAQRWSVFSNSTTQLKIDK